MVDEQNPDPLVSKTAQRARHLALGTNRTPAQIAAETREPADPELTPAEEPETAPDVVAPDLDAPAVEE